MNLVKNAIVGLALIGALTGCTAPKQFGRIAAYYDTRGKPTATLTGGASDFLLGTKLFGFMDIETEKENRDNLADAYAEIRISKKAGNGVGVAAEYNRKFSLPEGTARLGVLYEPDLSNIVKNADIGLKFYPASTNDKGMQLGLYGKKSFHHGDIYVGGFLDYNLRPDKAVSDMQFGKRIRDGLYFVIEGRYNGFMKKDDMGAGIGLEWKF